MAASTRSGGRAAFDLNEYFEFCSVLGSGNHAEVQLWQERKTREMIAVKFLKINSDPEYLPEEVQVMMRCYNSNRIVKFHGYMRNATGPGVGGVLMEHCKGGDLRGLRAHHETLKLGVPEKLLWHVFVQIAEGVAYLHHGYGTDSYKNKSGWAKILHNDIKPENILMQLPDEGNLPDIKIADFGLADVEESMSASRAMVLGMYGDKLWMPPETPELTNARDIWCIGAVIYYLATGRYVGALLKDRDAGKIRLADIPTKISDICCTPSEQLAKGMLSGKAWDFNYSQDLNYWMQRCLDVNPDSRISAQELVDLMVPTARRRITMLV